MLAAVALIVADGRSPRHAQATAPPLPSFDFRQASAVAEWGELHDVAQARGDGAGDGRPSERAGSLFLRPAHETIPRACRC